MTLVKWNNRQTAFEDINQWFNLLTDDDCFNQSPKTENWEPNVEIFQHIDHYSIQAELAGLNKKDVSIVLVDDLLKITGERKAIPKENNSKNMYSHIDYGTFYKSLRLPENIIENEISAKMENGILQIIIPLAKPILPETKKIMIN